MITQIDHDKLRQFVQPDIYKAVCDQTGHTGGIHDVEIEKLSLSKQKKFNLSLWSLNQHVAPPPEAEPEPEPQPQLSMAQIEAEEKQDIQRRVDKARAIQRVNDYVRDAGLAESDANGKLIREWIDNAGGVWTPELVDEAIVALNERLEWRSTEPAPPAAPESEKPEVLKPWQLPIDADKYQMKKASTKALLDLNQRRRKVTGQMILGKNAQVNRHGTNL